MKLRHLSSTQSPKSPRKDRCPDSATLAAFVDLLLGEQELSWIRQHLLQCDSCFETVNQLSILTRLPLPEVPHDLRRQAKALTQPRRAHWVSIPSLKLAGALAVLCVGIVVSAWFWRSQEAWPSPREFSPMFETVRGVEIAEDSLSVISPENNAVVPAAQVRFSWDELPGAVSYEVHLVDPEGTLVWSRNVGSFRTVAPHDVELKPGVYFLSVQASLSSGRFVKGKFVRFTVTD